MPCSIYDMFEKGTLPLYTTAYNKFCELNRDANCELKLTDTSRY